MSIVEIVAFIVGALLTLSRFLQAAKPLWGRAPQWLAFILPTIAAIIPSVIDMISGAKTVNDFVAQAIAALALIITNIFPAHVPAAKPVARP